MGELSFDHGMGHIIDPPKIEDYTVDTPAVAQLLRETRAGRRAATSSKPKAGELPPTVDLRRWFPAVEFQGALGSCSAHAVIGLLEYFEKRASGNHVDASRLFLYKTSRNLMGWTGDRGMFLRKAMQALVMFGAPPEQFWPYDGAAAASNTHYDQEPTAFCYALARNYAALKYFRLDTGSNFGPRLLEQIKTFAAAGMPCAFGFPVYREYEQPLPKGLIAYPGVGTYYRGAHANVVAGYDDTLQIGADKGALLVRNSWGWGWGDLGYGWLSYKYVTNGLVTDCWSMVTASWIDAGMFE